MNKGFTLVELLASIIIIGLILVITIPSYIYIYNSTRETSYNNKLNTIKQEALKYGEKIKDEIQADNCKDIEISELIRKGYLKSDYKTKDALENPLTKNDFTNNLSICYCRSNNELKAFYLDNFDYTKTYPKGTEIRYNGKVYQSMTSYNYNDIVDSINNQKKTDYKWNNSGNVTASCTGYLNKEIDLCITSISLVNETYVVNNFFKMIEC